MRAWTGSFIAAITAAVVTGCGIVTVDGGTSGGTDSNRTMACPPAAEVNGVLGTHFVFMNKEDLLHPGAISCAYDNPAPPSNGVTVSFEPDRDSASMAAYKAAYSSQNPTAIPGFQDEALTLTVDSGDPSNPMRQVIARKGSLLVSVLGRFPLEREKALVAELIRKAG